MHPYRWLALIGISLLAFIAFLDITIVNTAIPYIQETFKTSVLKLQWVSNAFTLLLSMTYIAAGNISDRFGQKKTFFTGVFLFAIASWGAGASPSLSFLIFARALQGLATSLIYTSSTAMLTTLFPQEEHPKAVSLYTGIIGTGLMAGPAVGGLLVGWLNWRWVFWINIPAFLIGLLLCAWSAKAPWPDRPAKTPRPIDLKSLLLLIIGLALFTYGTITGAEKGWMHVETLLPFGIGLVALITLTLLDLRMEHPLLELEIFKNRLLLLAIFSCIVAGLVSRVFIFFDPLYLKTVRSLSPFAIGFLVSVLPAAQVLLSLFFARLIKRFGVARLLLFSILSACFAAWMHTVFGEHFPYSVLVIALFMLGINWGLSTACMVSSARQEVAPEKAGAVIGTISTLWNIVGCLMLAISSGLFHTIQIKTEGAFLPGFHAVAFLNAFFISLVLAGALLIYGSLKKQ